jgi:streptogramin lyase
VTEYTVPTANSWPLGVAVTPDGAAWFAEYNTNKIGRVTAGGSFTEYPIPAESPSSGSPRAITAGPDGNLWFTDNNYIGRITTSGSITQFPVTPFSGPHDITPGPDGNVWFTESSGDAVGYVTPAGGVTEFSIAPVTDPLTITAGSDGALWFTALGTGNGPYLCRLTLGGSLTQYVLPSGMSAGDITTGPDRRLWLISSQTSLTAFTISGTYTTYTWQATSGYDPVYIRSDATGALVLPTMPAALLGG